MNNTRTTPRPIRIVPEPVVMVTCARHGPTCVQLCVCPRCGGDRSRLRAIASEGGPMNARDRACWSNRCEVRR